MSSEFMDRRRFLALSGGALSATALSLAMPGPAAAAPANRTDYPVRWLTGYETTAYVTYMHQNGFFRGSSHLVIRKAQSIGGTNLLHVCDLRSGQLTLLPPLPSGRPMIGGFWDIHYESGLLVSGETATQSALDNANPRVWTFDLEQFLSTGTATWQQVYEVPAGTTMADNAAAIHPDGTKVALSILGAPVVNPEVPGDRHSTVIEVDIRTGAERILAERDKTFNHVHYSPYDPSWVVFTREGASTIHKERVWAHHPVQAPTGKNICPQLLPDGTVLRLSHERAAFDSPTVVVINYENPRSVYRGYFDGRMPQLIARGNFEHCDISRDGRYIVVDTDLGRPKTSIQLIDLANGNAVTTIVPTTNRGVSHPRHNHPIFSPNGRYVLFNDPDPANVDSGGLRIGVVDLCATPRTA